MQEIEGALTRAVGAYQRHHGGELPPGARLHEQVERHTPLDALIEKETDVDAEGETAMRMYLEAHAWLFDFLFSDGPHPGRVMLRLYAWVKKYRPELIWDMGFRNLGLLLNESHAAMQWRIEVLLDDYASAKGLAGVKAPWQRTAEACASYSEAQKGNCNRLGGKRSAKFKGQQSTKKTS